MVFNEASELGQKQKKLLADIRKIVGGKTFRYSEAYLKKAGYEVNRIGKGERRVSVITKKYVYVNCHVYYETNNDNTEFGAYICKYPVCQRVQIGKNVTKVELEDLFVEDLEKVRNDLYFALWWEANERMPKIQAQLKECEQYAKLFNKVDEKSYNEWYKERFKL